MAWEPAVGMGNIAVAAAVIAGAGGGGKQLGWCWRWIGAGGGGSAGGASGGCKQLDGGGGRMLAPNFAACFVAAFLTNDVGVEHVELGWRWM